MHRPLLAKLGDLTIDDAKKHYANAVQTGRTSKKQAHTLWDIGGDPTERIARLYKESSPLTTLTVNGQPQDKVSQNVIGKGGVIRDIEEEKEHKPYDKTASQDSMGRTRVNNIDVEKLLTEFLHIST